MAATDREGGGMTSHDVIAGSDGTSAEEGLKYKKLPGFATTAGQDYEVKMSGLLFARGLNSKRDFLLGTNVAGAGALDDIVYKFTTPDQVCHTAFIQLKHKKSAKVNMDSLLNVRGDFSLLKYYESFMDIKQWHENDVNVGLFNSIFESCHFVIFTNAQQHVGKGEVETRDLSSPVDEYIKLNEIETSFTEHLVESIYSDLKTVEEKQKKPSRYPISSNEDDAKNFLRRFKLFTGQPSENQLDDVIKEELRKFGIEKQEMDAVYRLFLERMKAWWQLSEGVFLTPRSTILLEAHAEAMLPRVEKLTNKAEKKFRLDVKFLESSTADMRNACADQHSLVNVVSEYSLRLTASKVLQILQPQRDSYILLGTETLLKESRAVISAWGHGKKHLLVVISEKSTNQEKVKDIVAELSLVLKDKKDKKMILISAPSNIFATQLGEKMENNVIVRQDCFQMSQIDTKSINSILKKEVLLQGTLTTLGDMIGEDVDLITKELKDVLDTIIASDSLVIGDKLKEGISYFIPRTMQYKRVIKKQIFSDVNYAGRIIIYDASLIVVNNLIRDGDQMIGKKFQQCCEGLVFNASYGDKDKMRDASTRNDVHHLQLIEDRLIWKNTEGDINFIKKYIDETDLKTVKDPEDRVVLLIAEPGMGKTTQLVHVAQQTKQQHPNCWVLPVALNEHPTILAKKNPESFLYFVMGIEKMTAVAQALFKFCFKHTANFIVLLDGCDEIAPKYTDQCLALVQSLLKTKVKKVWIASRNSMKNNLESKLSTLATEIRKFNKADQRKFLFKYWEKHEEVKLSKHDLDSFITRILENVERSTNDKGSALLGIPLHTRIAGDIFQIQIRCNDMILPNKFNGFHLIEKFVENRCTAFCDRTLKLNELNVNFEHLLDEQLNTFYEKHSNVAMILLFGDKESQSLKSFETGKSTKLMANIEKGTEKTGIIDRVVHGKPVFIHRVFAEFFAAHWLSEHIDNNTEFFMKHLLGNTSSFIRQAFDRFLAQGCDLHNALLNGDLESVRAFLRSGRDVNVVDRGGRTALHLAIIAGLDDFSEIKPSKTIIQLMMTYKAKIDVKDKVLQWTPAQYADEYVKSHYEERTALLWASRTGRNEIVQLLLSSAADKYERDENGYNALIIASVGGYTSVVKSLLASFNNASDRTKYVNDRRDNGPSALWMASFQGHCAIVQILISAGADPTTRISNGLNPLIAAIIFNHVSVVSALLASFKNKSDRVKYVNMHSHNGNSAIGQASFLEQLDMVMLLISAGADLTARGANGLNPLMTAIMFNHVSVVSALLASFKNKSDRVKYVNIRGDDGKSPIWLASALGQLDMVKLLISAGADLTTRDSEGINPLMIATTRGNLHVVRALLAEFDNASERADYVNSRHEKYQSALFIAIIKCQSDIATLLIKAGADLTSRGSKGINALMMASLQGNESVVRALLDAFNNDSES